MPHTTKAQSTRASGQQQDSANKNSDRGHNTIGATSNTNSNGQPQKPSKVMITGDDILIEYVSRLSKTLNHMAEEHIDGA